MTQSDTGTTLVKLRKMIESMQKEEMRQIQSTHSDALAQIVSIAKQNQLNERPLKRWLAKVGKERLDEIENPDLAWAACPIDRAKAAPQTPLNCTT